MFAKLPCIFTSTDQDWDYFKTDKCFVKFYSEKRGGGSYFYSLNDHPHLTNLLQPDLFKIPPTIVSYCEFTGPGLVTPHRDQGDRVALNFYLDTDDGITIFYREARVPVVDTKLPRLTLTSPVEDLIETDRFSAQRFDCYLLDVSMIHGIQKYTDTPRTMITFRWRNHDYKTILNSLNFTK